MQINFGPICLTAKRRCSDSTKLSQSLISLLMVLLTSTELHDHPVVLVPLYLEGGRILPRMLQLIALGLNIQQ